MAGVAPGSGWGRAIRNGRKQDCYPHVWLPGWTQSNSWGRKYRGFERLSPSSAVSPAGQLVPFTGAQRSRGTHPETLRVSQGKLCCLSGPVWEAMHCHFQLSVFAGRDSRASPGKEKLTRLFFFFLWEEIKGICCHVLGRSGWLGEAGGCQKAMLGGSWELWPALAVRPAIASVFLVEIGTTQHSQTVKRN